MKVRTAEPLQIEDLRHRIAGIQGALGQSEVKEIRDSSVPGKGYTLFTITYKLARDESGEGATQAGEKQIKDALAGVLAPDPVVLTVTPGETNAAVSGTIAFDEAHPTGDITALLTSRGLQAVNVQAPTGEEHTYAFTATTDKGDGPDRLKMLVNSAFVGAKDSTKAVYSLRSPVPESSLVGPQVGADLRNKAVLAIVLSLVGTMLYLRIRFAELGYGVAVVVSLIHDVFMTLTWISIACATGLVQAEIDLAMVAAFLTIIGYSQNDTIVIFDRVRENRPKSKDSLEHVLNASINQTLARTILTTSTVVLTLVVLFAFNIGTRNVLEGFSFAMLVGVLSGAYSTVYIASPVLLWFEKWQARKGGPGAASGLGARDSQPPKVDGASQLTTTGS
jgi:preprotein translocase subunit SecF